MARRFLKHNPKTVVMIGMGPSISSLLGECLTQEFKPDWADEVWAINMASNAFWHDVVLWMDDLDAQEKFRPALFSVLRRRNKPVITTKADRTILPNSFDYPIDEVAQVAMPIFGKVYLNNGVAMGIAYAMVKGVKTLKMYGCDFTYPDRNYAESGRACTEAWMALACAAGMTIALPRQTSLFDAVEAEKGVYGYGEQPIINLPGGKVLQPDKPSASGGYVPEDSAPKKEVKNEVRRRVPGTNGVSAQGARTA